MSTITDALKNFYKKLGGSLSNIGPNATSADIVDAMAEVYTDKEGTYVEVTEEVTEGKKIATITTNNEAHDIYAPDISDLEKLLPMVDFDENDNVNAIKLGNNNVETGTDGIINGNNNTVSGNYDLVIGRDNTADGTADSVISGRQNSAHNETQAGGINDIIVGGRYNEVDGYGMSSIISGNHNKISGPACFVSGTKNIASHSNQLVFGNCNIPDPSTGSAKLTGTYIEIVGNGSDETHRSNARTLDWHGNEVLAGDLTISVNGTPTSLAEFIQKGSFIDYEITGSGTSFTLANNKTCKNVIDDVAAGKNVRLYTESTNDFGKTYIYYGLFVSKYEDFYVLNPGSKTVEFGSIIFDGSSLKHYTLYVNYNDEDKSKRTISATIKTITTT